MMKIRIFVMVVLCTQASGQLLGGIPGMGLPANPNHPDTVFGGLKGILDAGFNRINKQLENLTLPPDPPTPAPADNGEPEGDDPDDKSPEDGSPENENSDGGGNKNDRSGGEGQENSGSQSGGSENDGSNSGAGNSGNGESDSNPAGSTGGDNHNETPGAGESFDWKSPKLEPFDWKSPNSEPFDWKTPQMEPFEPKPIGLHPDIPLYPKPSDSSKPIDPSWYTNPIGPYDYGNIAPEPFAGVPNQGNPWSNDPKPGPFDNLQLTGPYDIHLNTLPTGNNLQTHFFDTNTGFDGTLTGTKDFLNPDTGHLSISSPFGDSGTTNFQFQGDTDFSNNFGYELNMDTKSHGANAFLRGSSDDGKFPYPEAGFKIPFITAEGQQLDFSTNLKPTQSGADTKFGLNYNDLQNGYSGYYSQSQTGKDLPNHNFGGSAQIYDTDLNTLILKGGYGEDPHIMAQIKDKLNEQDHSIKLKHDNNGGITDAEIHTTNTIDGKPISVAAQTGDVQKVKVDYGNLGSITAEQLQSGHNFGVGTTFDVKGYPIDVEATVGAQPNVKVRVNNPETGFTKTFTLNDKNNPQVGFDISRPIYHTKDLDLFINAGGTAGRDGNIQSLLEIQGTFAGR